jgi:pimeloyl-CoA synthetase
MDRVRFEFRGEENARARVAYALLERGIPIGTAIRAAEVATREDGRSGAFAFGAGVGRVFLDYSSARGVRTVRIERVGLLGALRIA